MRATGVLDARRHAIVTGAGVIAIAVAVAVAGLGLGADAAESRSRRVEPAPGISEGIRRVAGIEYGGGTHLAFTSRGRRDYAFAAAAPGSSGSPGALRAIDITRPKRPVVVDTLDCGFNQGYLGLSGDGRTLLLGSDSPDISGAECLTAGGMGFLTVDVSDPRKMRPLHFAPVQRGVHGATVHPDAPLVYVSYGDVVATAPAEFEIWSIADPSAPRMLDVVAVPGYHGPHDMTFDPTGDLMVASNVSTLQVFDTTEPTEPTLISTTQCPGCTHTHESRFTPDGKRLVVTDETMTAPNPCPGGGLYFYDVGPDGELTLTGHFQPTAVGIPEGRSEPTFCTSHVIGLSPDGNKIAASWHGAGVRYINMTDSDGVSLGDDASTGRGPRELGWFVAEDSDAMSAKFYKGPYIYSNDANRGFEVFRTPQD